MCIGVEEFTNFYFIIHASISIIYGQNNASARIIYTSIRQTKNMFSVHWKLVLIDLHQNMKKVTQISIVKKRTCHPYIGLIFYRLHSYSRVNRTFGLKVLIAIGLIETSKQLIFRRKFMISSRIFILFIWDSVLTLITQHITSHS